MINRILLTNDDGYESPALVPTIEALEQVGNVEVVVPSRNQSWTSKANTRRDAKINVETIEIQGREITTFDGLPADCANYGLFREDSFPDLLVSGANVGHNVGLAAFVSSGTVGAAMEGLLVGVPSIAVSSPYSYGDELIEENFRPAVKLLPKIVETFYHKRPENFQMFTMNLPMKVENEYLVAVELEKHYFGKLFEEKDGIAEPIFYPKLIQPTPKKDYTDAWAREQKLSSVIALDKMANRIDKKITAEWLKKVGLARE